jgi:hypothetical protein
MWRSDLIGLISVENWWCVVGVVACIRGSLVVGFRVLGVRKFDSLSGLATMVFGVVPGIDGMCWKVGLRGEGLCVCPGWCWLSL